MASFALTARQVEANRLLGGAATHVMLLGGARSGKTFLIVRGIVTRALAVAGSRHVALRYRFNHLKGSIIYDTLPKVMELCFPGVGEHCRLDKVDWRYLLPNGSEIWFGGLDEKERTEKILGSEFATIYLNECSQIPWTSRNMAVTRLAQNVGGLRLRAWYDCNPPSQAHWTYRLFVARQDPDSRAGLNDPDNYAFGVLNPADNAANLDAAYLRELEGLPERMRRRFLLGEFAAASDNALWSLELLDRCRVHDGRLPDMQRIVVAVDPSGCSGEEDMRSDEVGIVVCGLGVDGKGYVLEDLSGRHAPPQWGRIVAAAYDRHAADCVVAEVNYGGAMVREVMRAARANTPFREVRASRGKAVRAEPVAFLFEQDKARLAGVFPALEDQLCSMTTAGWAGDRSPDRADAMVWGLTELFPAVARGKRPPGAVRHESCRDYA